MVRDYAGNMYKEDAFDNNCQFMHALCVSTFLPFACMCANVCAYMCIYIYIYTYACVCVCVLIFCYTKFVCLRVHFRTRLEYMYVCSI